MDGLDGGGLTMARMTPRQLEKLVAEWQHRLRLDDWDIELVTIAAATTDYVDNKAGQCYTRSNSRSARIVVATDGDDPEHTIVHELLHVALHECVEAQWRATAQLGEQAKQVCRDDYDGADEMAVQRLTTALVQAHRGEN